MGVFFVLTAEINWWWWADSSMLDGDSQLKNINTGSIPYRGLKIEL